MITKATKYIQFQQTNLEIIRIKICRSLFKEFYGSWSCSGAVLLSAAV